MANDDYENDDAGTMNRQLKAAEQLPAGLMLLKMENESMMSVARTAPRDNAAIVKQLEALIEAYPAAADEAVYRKPVGSVTEGTCKKCGIRYELPYKLEPECPGCACPEVIDREKTMKFAEGLSIRAAESIRAIYGYNRLAVTTEPLEDGKVKISATFVDYSACNMTTDDAIISPWYKQRGGGMARTPEDRFLNVVVKAEKSKLVRDVILDGVPNIIKAAFREACERKMAGLLAPEEVDQKIIPHFAKMGLSVEHLEKMLGNKPKALGWTVEDRLRLKQIATAIKNNETTVATLLRDLRDEPEGNGGKAQAAGAAGSVQGSDLTKKPDKKTEPPKETKKQTNGTGQAAQQQTTPPEAGKDAGKAPSESTGTPGPTEEEKNEIARDEFDQVCREKFEAEWKMVQECKTTGALDKLVKSIDKSTGKDYTPQEANVMRKWVANRRAEIKSS